MLREQLLNLLLGYDFYLNDRRVDKLHPIHDLLHVDIPLTLASLTLDSVNFKFKGSDGQGNVTEVPWVAAFHKEITLTATTGYYVVWLFPESRKEVILELGLGVTQFSDLWGENSKALDAAGRAGSKVLNISKPHIDSIFDEELKRRCRFGEIPPFGPKFDHKAYGKAAVVSVSYPVDSIPGDAELASDFQQFMRLYRRLIASPLMPTIDELVVDEIVSTNIAKLADSFVFEVKEFEPRERRQSLISVKREDQLYPRHSRASKKIGDRGESLVYNYLRQQLRESGRDDLADQVIWHQESLSERTPGWDITSFDSATGKQIRVEVKASQGKTINEVILTRKEWIAAAKYASSYYVYLISNVLKNNPTIEIIRDPAGRAAAGEILVTEESWSLKL